MRFNSKKSHIMKKKSILLFLASFVVITFNSCLNNTGDGLAGLFEGNSTKDNNDAYGKYQDVHNIVEAGFEDGGKRGVIYGCATVSLDATKKLLTIDFGPDNCLGTDGHNRRGKIYVNYDGTYPEKGFTRTTIFEDYYVNDVKVEGTRTVTFTEVSSSEVTMDVDVVDGMLTFTDGKTIQWNADREITFVKGSTPFTGQYQIRGNSNGTNRAGEKFTSVINTDLIMDVTCLLTGNRLPSSGNETLTPEGKSPRTVDFGTGDCDFKFSVTVDGKTYNFGS